MPQKTLPKERRLAKAKAWIPKYDGQHIIKGYRKHFGVDCLTAIRDLTELGIIDEATSQNLQRQEKARMVRVQQQREEKKAAEWAELHKFQNDRFYYIAGYTPGGAPYGVTWEEMGLEPWEEIEEP